ncbi:hypothetical protein DV737_g5015, partial [Chaetothyriales sp. CBS 132003]
MRVRIRGPGGQSTVTLDDASATVDTLRKTIETETSLTSYTVKYGYPPKELSLDELPLSKLLSDLDIKLNGEQLLISRSETASKQANTVSASAPPWTSAASPAQSHATTATTASCSKVAPSTGSNPLGVPASLSKQPLSLSRKQKLSVEDDPPEVPVPELGGVVILRIMPDDNSCLFRAISSAVMSDVDAVTELRSIVAESIQADGDTYTKAVLDNKDPSAYCRWIQSSNSWGGQVELVILAKYFGVEIFAIDVQHLRVDRYNEGGSQRRCLVVYSGIHYDTIALNIGGGGMPESDVKQFEPAIKDRVLAAALDLCAGLRDRHYYTDTAGFKIRCNECGAQVVGEQGATEHASRTGHYNFGEGE